MLEGTFTVHIATYSTATYAILYSEILDHTDASSKWKNFKNKMNRAFLRFTLTNRHILVYINQYNMDAVLKYHHKALIQDRFVVEVVIYEVSVTRKYPDGVKYRLICIDQKEGRKILMDNHHPKGSHVHINEQELEYIYVSEDKLMEDFNKLILTHMGVRL